MKYGEEDVMARYQRKETNDEKITQRDDRGVEWNIPAGGAISEGCSPTEHPQRTSVPSGVLFQLLQRPSTRGTEPLLSRASTFSWLSPQMEGGAGAALMLTIIKTCLSD